ncbi:MAG: DUF2970 domain-containing protein [Candidatus Zeuxoniibacter abyssi]|nr:MAG: DUF2970 domain-containing protein [Candidatus Persebacteraceae bacterium AB1(2)]
MKPFFRALNAVLSAFFGVRGKKSADKDSAAFHPQHVIIAGVLAVLGFIAVLITVVNFVTA